MARPVSPVPRGTLIVYRSGGIISSLICLLSGGKWDHIAMALGDGTAIQAEAAGGGVCLRPDVLQEPGIDSFPYPGDVEHCIAFYEQCLKYRDYYDFEGLLADPIYNITGFPMHLREHGWNCATFMVAPMLTDPKVAGKLLKKPPATFTPNDFKVMFGE